MDYQRIYNQLIERAKNRVLEKGIYSERHHIVPRCIGGSDSPENLVSLTAREHFIAHWLLARQYPENYKLAYAIWAMVNQTNNSNQLRKYTVSSRVYQSLREQFASKHGEVRRGCSLPLESRRKMSKTRTGQTKGQYKSKELSFVHKCKGCGITYTGPDVKGSFCIDCKKPRECRCGCNTIVKTPGRYYARGCQTRGKNYQEIYNNKNPKCGFRKGNKNGKTNNQ